MIKVKADIDSIAGYSAYTRDILQLMYENGESFWVEPVVWGDAKMELTGFWKERYEELTTPKSYDTVIYIGLPDRHYGYEEGKKNIGLTHWEVSRIGKKWVDIMNTMDEIWTGSKFAANVFVECGLNKPTKVVWWNIPWINIPHKKREKYDKFVFLHHGTFDERKNFKDLILAYCMEFQKECIDDNAESNVEYPTLLRIKTYKGKLDGIAHGRYVNKEISYEENVKRETEVIINSIKQSMSLDRYPLIEIIQDKVSDDELWTMYADTDCLAYTSHGEGVGGPILFANAYDIPVIAANYSSIPEYAKKHYPVKYCLEPVHDMQHILPYRCMPLWARLDITSLRQQMRKVYEDSI